MQEVSNNIPPGYRKPEMGSNSSGLGQVFWYTLERTDNKLKSWISDMDLRTRQNWTVRLILRTTPGVDDVTSWGGEGLQYQVRIDPLKLIAYDLDYSDAIAAIDANNRQISGQFIDRGAEQYLVRGLGLVNGEREIGENRGQGAGQHARLFKRCCADHVGTGFAFWRGYSRRQRSSTRHDLGENAAHVVDAIKARLAVVRQALPDGVKLTPMYDRTGLVKKDVETTERASIEGSILEST